MTGPLRNVFKEDYEQILAFVRVDKFVNYSMPAMPSNQVPPSNQGVFFFIMSASNMIYENVCENVFLCI